LARKLAGCLVCFYETKFLFILGFYFLRFVNIYWKLYIPELVSCHLIRWIHIGSRRW